jgi:hypothetical protein
MADTRRTEKPERPIPHIQWTCGTCEREAGVASNATTRIRKGGYVNLKTGKLTGGTFFEVCAMCLVRGKTTIICQG